MCSISAAPDGTGRCRPASSGAVRCRPQCECYLSLRHSDICYNSSNLPVVIKPTRFFLYKDIGTTTNVGSIDKVIKFFAR